jgi:UDP-N-acetylmuramate dehydrogenase
MTIQPLREISLAEYTTLQMGGRARYFYQATTDSEIVQAAKWATDAHVALHVLGGGSNLVVAATGLSGLVMRIAIPGVSAERHGSSTTIRAGAGVAWDDLVQFSVERALSGLECLSGIPGTVGATPIQNVGAYGHEISGSLTHVEVYDRVEGRHHVLDRDACEFGYRDSRFKSREPERYIVLAVEFELSHEPPSAIRHGELAARLDRAGHDRPSVQQIRDAVLTLRRDKGLLVTLDSGSLRSAGSFFVNPVVDADTSSRLVRSAGPALPVYPQADGRVKLSAAWLIENSGFARGYTEGKVGLSPHHCLVLVAHGRAVADDLVTFAHRIREAVRARFGVELRPEPNFWGFDQLDAGLPVLDERIPATLGSPSQRVKGEDP